MKTKSFVPLLTVTLGFAADGTCTTWAHARADTVVAVETESFPRVNMQSLAGNLKFLGAMPELAGHPLLIEFWATWCPPCRASIAHLNELNKSCHDLGLQIIGITSEDKAVVERFRSRVPMHYAVALDEDQALANQFQVRSIPNAWLLDKEGRVIWSGHPAELDEQILAQVLPSHPAT